ncbi:hypothetical protein CASFOL_042020 [Castilleja foliolosa]|uniref:BZIP domain-containing protein n=1 Tax=Castilleja foliolosa TaxID=1961234 RepID=A0ABD3BA14_9LAMI
MGEDELDFPSNQMLSCLDIPTAQSSCSFDIDEFLGRTPSCNDALGGRTEAYTDDLGRTQACTHAHACNPSGPDKSHTHTCIHVHTQIMPSPSDDTADSVEKKSKKRPLGNREAVRKYREKKKARAASLEDEVNRLRALNQQLMKRLQGQSLLEAEIARLKCLLVDIRGRIEGEIGSFPYQKPNLANNNNNFNPNSMNGTYVVNSCNMQRNDQIYCLHQGSENVVNNGQGLGDCGFDDLQCLGNQNGELKEFADCGLGDNVVLSVNMSGNNRRKGTRATIGI